MNLYSALNETGCSPRFVLSFSPAELDHLMSLAGNAIEYFEAEIAGLTPCVSKADLKEIEGIQKAKTAAGKTLRRLKTLKKQGERILHG